LILAQALKQVSGPKDVEAEEYPLILSIQSGLKYTIFEKDVSLNYRSNEWTMAIHWSLVHLEKLLPPELYAKLELASCNPSVPIDAGGNYPIINGDTGAMLAGVPYARGLRVPRSKMRALCAEGINVEVGFSICFACVTSYLSNGMI
jgi:hypothetical protein